MPNTQRKYRELIFLLLFLLSSILLYFTTPYIFSGHYLSSENNVASVKTVTTNTKEIFVPTYINTPESVKGIYLTSWTTSSKKLRDALIKLVDETELNAVVIDIKDYSGKIVFPVSDVHLKSFGSEEVRIPDLQDFIEELHKKNIYVIGRVAVFQDAYFVKHRPDLAVKTKSGVEVWKDRKGISWIDAGSKEYWDYILQIAKESRKIGFDEINFDYIRFPSDGDMENISFPWSSTTPKSIVLKNFFEYLYENLVSTSTERLKISADLFGMVTTATGDMGIGQILENALPYFDYISPMVYPSHYPPDFNGFKNPEAHPYEIVYYAMNSAVDRTNKASTTPSKLRPWLQDFGLKVTYGPDDIRKQIKATNDVGLNSWLLWSASNRYTKDALHE